MPNPFQPVLDTIEKEKKISVEAAIFSISLGQYDTAIMHLISASKTDSVIQVLTKIGEYDNNH